MIHRHILDHMPTSMHTMYTRLRQLHDFMGRWRYMSDVMGISRFMGIRIKLTILTEMVVDGRRICNEHDFFKVEGIERVW